MNLDEVGEIEILDGDKFSSKDLNIPSNIEVKSMVDLFGVDITEPKDIQIKVREKLVPLALNTYKSLLNSGDPKIKKSAADTIMEVAGLKGNSIAPPKVPGGLGGITFNLMPEEKKNLIGAFGEIIKGELIVEAEVIE